MNVVAIFVDEGGSKKQCEEAIRFMERHAIEWISYAMLGGRLKERSLRSEEAVSSAAHTALFALSRGAREVIINSQYLDPLNLQEQARDNVDYYVPTEEDMRNTARLVVAGMTQLSLPEGSKTGRVRLTTDKEDVIEGTIGPIVSPAFRQLILDFNNAKDQIAFFSDHIQR